MPTKFFPRNWNVFYGLQVSRVAGSYESLPNRPGNLTNIGEPQGESNAHTCRSEGKI